MKENIKIFKNRPVAYFCAEYALFDHTPLYTGGLGILAGDYINEIVKQNFPAIAIGLFYHKEHLHGLELSRERKTPSELGLELLKDKDGSILKIPIFLGDHSANVQIWKWSKGQLTLFLLDTQVEENSPYDWTITDTLYVEDRDLRLKQEIILGIGGMKVIKRLNINPSVYHLNEGHSSFMTSELISNIVEENKVGFDEAVRIARERIVFTNHTLVQAGQEMFDINAMKSIFSEDFIKLGYEESVKMFSMTNLALNMSSKVNAVSVLHGKMAKDLWSKYNKEVVTNGIFIERWDNLKYYSHKESKRKLIDYIKQNNKITLDENVLILGWSRRFVEYKRPLAILGDVERFKKIAKDENRKVVIVYSSIVNKTYDKENHFIKELEDIIDNDLQDNIIFIPNYDMDIAKMMVSGCDVWLNTPEVGREACGTSGMKACLNGVLPLSTSDGWIDEVDLTNIGWKVQDGEITKNLLDIIEQQIIPSFYDDKNNWNDMMKNSRNLILNQFSTERMLNEYIKKMYLPIFSKSFH